MEKLIFRIAMRKSKPFLVRQYSQHWFTSFQALARQQFYEILPRVPDIGSSIFSLNYQFAPTYIAWYQALSQLGVPPEEIDHIIWKMNEKLLDIIPAPLMGLAGKFYFRSFRKKAQGHLHRQNTEGIHPYDWQIEYREVDDNYFEIDIKTCGIKKLAEDFGASGLLPGLCRMDYLFAHRMKNGFERTKTLGDGDDCCNCRFFVTGSCEWAPEKGFTTRK